jgi:hypothetical protein
MAVQHRLGILSQRRSGFYSLNRVTSRVAAVEIPWGVAPGGSERSAVWRYTKQRVNRNIKRTGVTLCAGAVLVRESVFATLTPVAFSRSQVENA